MLFEMMNRSEGKNFKILPFIKQISTVLYLATSKLIDKDSIRDLIIKFWELTRKTLYLHIYKL